MKNFADSAKAPSCGSVLRLRPVSCRACRDICRLDEQIQAEREQCFPLRTPPCGRKGDFMFELSLEEYSSLKISLRSQIVTLDMYGRGKIDYGQSPQEADYLLYDNWTKLKQRLKEEGNERVTSCHQLKMIFHNNCICIIFAIQIQGIWKR